MLFNVLKLQLGDEHLCLSDKRLGFRNLPVLRSEKTKRSGGVLLLRLRKCLLELLGRQLTGLLELFGSQFADTNGCGLHLRGVRICGFVLLEELAVGRNRVLLLRGLKVQLADAVFGESDLLRCLRSFLVGGDEGLVRRNGVLGFDLPETQFPEAGAGLGYERSRLGVRLILGDVGFVGWNSVILPRLLKIRLDGGAANQEGGKQGYGPEGELRRHTLNL